MDDTGTPFIGAEGTTDTVMPQLAGGNNYDPSTGQALNPSVQQQLNPGLQSKPPSMTPQQRYNAITGMQSAISSPFQHPQYQPDNAFDAIFGHASNPTPSQQMPSFSQAPQVSAGAPSIPQPMTSNGGAPPISMANPSLQTPSFQMVSDRKAKKDIQAAPKRDWQMFLTHFYKVSNGNI